MVHQITLLPGDGIGPEVAEATVRVVEAAGVEAVWERIEVGAAAMTASGELLPEAVFQSLERTRVGLKGPTATPIGGGHQSINVMLRQRLDLYVNFRPVRMLPGLKTRFQGVPIDLVIFRENTEDLYSGLEHEVVKDVVESLKIITRTASIRIARATFQFARRGVTEESHRGSQGQHHEDERRPVLAMLPGNRGRVSGNQVRRADRG